MSGDEEDTGNGSRPRDSTQIHAAIDDARRQIAASVIALRAKADLALDWREWFRRRPGLFIGAAFALGFIVGAGRRR